jgi:NAD(P)-dependent dehydrogenase (short-subunit alcohol dehydrogenase family)
VVDAIVKADGSATFTRIDVLDFAAVEARVQAFVQEHETLDVVTSTVDGGDFVPFLQMDGAFFEKELHPNLVSTVNCARAAAAPMVAQDSGRMLFFTPTTAVNPGSPRTARARPAWRA